MSNSNSFLTVGKCKALLKESGIDLSQAYVSVDSCDFDVVFDFPLSKEPVIWLLSDMPPTFISAAYFLEHISCFADHVRILHDSQDDVRLILERFPDGLCRFNFLEQSYISSGEF